MFKHGHFHKWKELWRNHWRNPWGEYRYVGRICKKCGKREYSQQDYRLHKS